MEGPLVSERRGVWWVLACSVALASCGDMEEMEDPDARLLEVGEVTPECSTGVRWTGGVKGSPLMMPGGDCIACHAATGGPTFTAAGTVHRDFRDEDSCAGVPGVTVQLTGADGRVVEVVTNAAGNFHTTAPLARPYQATLLLNGGRRVMPVPQSEGSCNSCHTRNGKNGAPGRAVAPR